MLSDLYQQKKRAAANGGFDKTLAVTTAGTTQDVLAPKVAGLTLRIQKVKVTVNTASAGKTWQLRAKTTTTEVYSGVLDMGAAGATVYAYDFGAKGKALPAGETLEVNISAAGASGTIEVEGFYA